MHDLFRDHGITPRSGRLSPAPELVGFDASGQPNPWAYEMVALGYNYRLADIACALGISQLAKLDRFAARRRAPARPAIARALAAARSTAWCAPPKAPPGCDPALHLFVVLIDFEAAGQSRKAVIEGLRARGIGSQVHYIPVHRQPYYRDRYGEIDLPGADAYYARCLSLPLFASMEAGDVDRVVEALRQAVRDRESGST